MTPTDLPTAFTAGHRRLLRMLDGIGLDVQAERGFGPYCVDAYCVEVHVAFEFDGPLHSRTRDVKRDRWLLEEAGLPVMRLTAGDVGGRHMEETEERMKAFVAEHADTLQERKERGRWLAVTR